jgi:hypothetical protein
LPGAPQLAADGRDEQCGAWRHRRSTRSNLSGAAQARIVAIGVNRR